MTRISGLSFGRVRDQQGRYAILLNRGALRHRRERILSPIGGGVELTEDGKRYIERLFGARDFEQPQDLRCRVPDDQARRIATWFVQANTEHRETSVMRELREELVQETDILVYSDLSTVTEQLAGTYRYPAVTAREVPEKNTLYLIDVFDVTLGSVAMRKLAVAAQAPVEVRQVYFVTAAEIRAKVTNDGVAIGPISKFILF